MASFSDSIAYLQPGLRRVRAVMEEALQSDVALLKQTNQSVLDSGGKMIRPALALLVAGASGILCEDSIRFAAAAELIHNATLLHDDVVDQAAERRSRPTPASVLGGTAAVLVGDFWLVKAVGCILAAQRDSGRVVRIFSKTLSDLAEGELLQMQKASSADTTREEYHRIIYSKTASLFEATALSAAISAGASEEMVQRMGTFARSVGMAFQIRDDMFDYMETAVTGKPAGLDLREGKITEPLLSALDRSPAAQERIRDLVRRIPSEPSLEGQVRAFVLQNRGMEGAAAAISGFVSKAQECLAPLDESKEKADLIALSRYIGERVI